ncbi:peptidyl-prolyl cis-trans isomerase FKBP53-like [Tasmannia lanceolata]|uniref:peptidyl-prolyl cis-trans isomerase FKBP53-like n=1 Tax=Tasmannia lanceolata TaxID=3420 RepID=UPI0040634828
MTFWGVEIKPGTPYTHRNDETRVRLHIGQAILGSGPKTKNKVVVQCNIGNKSPVLICALLPDKSEWCPLNLEFEEEDDVIFSVLGPKSVHLSGYYLRPLINRDGEETDSYGEDIVETDTDQSSDYDESEDEYDDDFIDDDDLEMSDASPKPKNEAEIAEIVDDQKSANGNGTHRRLKKKFQISDSDGDGGSEKQIIKTSNTPVLESEDEDDFPISSIFKKHDIKKSKAKEKLDKKTDEECMTKKAKDESHRVTCLKRKVDAIDQDGDSTRSVNAAAVIQDENKKMNNKKRKTNEVDANANSEEPGKMEEVKKEPIKEQKAEVLPLKAMTYPNGLVVEELSTDKQHGKRASPGKKVSIHYSGILENGDVFDSNIGQSPFKFRLGKGKVIKGFDVGIEGMHVGDKRRLTIPPSMGYGFKDVGKIPGKSTLVFDVELVHVK